LFLHYMIELVC